MHQTIELLQRETPDEYEYLRVDYEYRTLEILSRVAYTATTGVIFVKKTV